MVSFGLFSGIIFAVGLAASVIAHELGHSLTARVFGYDTRSITLSVLGGCAEMNGIPTKPQEEILVAAAGPAVSFAIGCFGLMLVSFGISFTAFVSIVTINVVLGIFNLMPGFPMDGGRILRATLSMFKPRCKATELAMKVGRGFAILLGVFGLVQICLGHFGGGISLFIAYMIWKVGYAEYLATLHMRP